MRYVLAELRPASEKKKKYFLAGNRLASNVDSEAINNAIPGYSWSLIIHFIGPSADDSEVWLGHVSFLVNSAPHHLLYPGAEMDFCEGNIVAIHIKVLSIEQDLHDYATLLGDTARSLNRHAMEIKAALQLLLNSPNLTEEQKAHCQRIEQQNDYNLGSATIIENYLTLYPHTPQPHHKFGDD